jgi:ribosomal protein S18 acetylase RimI-like enzyme
MIVIAPITLDNLALFKAVRLRALLDTPSAFSATYAKESQFTDEEWKNRALRWNGEIGIGFLAMDSGEGCGIAGSLLDPGDPSRAQLISMWTAPLHRQRGIGRMLIDRVAAWAHRRGATVLNLRVTSSNGPAILFYTRLGFAGTGRTFPYPNDSALIEYEMARPLTQLTGTLSTPGPEPVA